MSKNGAAPKCSKGHTLALMTVKQLKKHKGYSTGYNCDVCKFKWASSSNKSDNDEVMHCGTCNYDLCPTCFKKSLSPGSLVMEDQEIQQWVEKVVEYSSQYDSYSYPAKNIEGEPQTVSGNYKYPWLMSSNRENWVVVQFAKAVEIHEIEIYENQNPGYVLKIMAKPQDGQNYVTLYSRTAPEKGISNTKRTFVPALMNKEVFSNNLRVEFGTCTDYVRIEGIRIKGDPLEKPRPEFITKVTSLFEKITSEPHTELGGEELTNFFTTLGVTDEVDPTPFVVFYKLKCPKGTFTIPKESFVNEFARRRVTTFQDIIRLTKDWKQMVLDNMYDSFYGYVIDYMRGERKGLPAAEALTVWRVLGMPTRWNLFSKWTEFISQNEKLVLPRDTLVELLTLSRAYTIDSQEYDDTGSYPVLFDSFVEWLQKHK